MKVFSFIGWWWNKVHPDDKILYIAVLAIMLFVIYAVVTGLGFIFSVITVVVFIATVLLGTVLVRSVMAEWRSYNQKIEREQQAVVDKLRGTR
jgi:membrane protein insertase Oxa1/YidC/SpoIIIJ